MRWGRSYGSLRRGAPPARMMHAPTQPAGGAHYSICFTSATSYMHACAFFCIMRGTLHVPQAAYAAGPVSGNLVLGMAAADGN